MIIEYLNALIRYFGYIDKSYLPLREIKGKFSGKRCIIANTGPSLTIEDLELLKNEYVFGMNSICLIHDKTDWKPDFFGIQDIHVFDKLKDSLFSTDNGLVFVPNGLKKLYNLPSNWISYPMCGSYHIYEMIYGPKYFAKFSDDCYVKVYDGYSISYSLLQLSIYLGFDEIYLLGADCSYLGQQQHFIETGHYDPGFKEASARLFASYGEANKYAQAHDIKIFNATRGGLLELFPRVNLEDVLNKKEKNKTYN